MRARKPSNALSMRRSIKRLWDQAPAIGNDGKGREPDPQSMAHIVERLTRIQDVTAALSQALTPEEVATVIVEQGIAASGAYAGGVSLISDDGTKLKALRIRGYSSDVEDKWRTYPIGQVSPLTSAISSVKPIYISSRAEWLDDYPSVSPVSQSQSWAALPLVVHGHVIGGMTLSFATERPFTADDRSFLEALAHQCAQALERARLYAAEHTTRLLAEIAWKRVKLLSEASVLLATTLEYQFTLANITRLIVPTFADYCIIHLVSETGTLEFAAAAHVDPRKEELIQAMYRHYPPRIDPPSGIGLLFVRGESVLIDHIPENALSEIAIDSAHAAYLHELRPVSSIFVPLRSRGCLLGSITLSLAETGRQYTQDDLAMVEELARRGAAAIDKAQLYRDAQQATERAEQAAARTLRLQSVTAQLSGALTAEDIAAVIVQAGSTAFQADAGTVYQLLDNDQAFELIGYTGYAEEIIPSYRRVSSTRPGPLRDAVFSRELIIVETAAAFIARWPHLQTVQNQSGDVATVAIPLLTDQRVLGVFYLAFRSERYFDDDDRAFLATLGGQCAQALERAQLYEQERQARAASEAAVHLRDVFLMTASHELRTPLTSLLGYADLLKRRVQRHASLPEREQHMLSVIVSQAERLNTLIGALLDISLIQSGGFRIAYTPLDLSPIVGQAVMLMEPTLSQHTLTCTLPEGPVLVHGDAVRLRQVVDNLLHNAIKYSPEGGPIRVRVERHTDHALLFVTDQGIGIPREAIDQIVTKFYRAANVIPEQMTGLGIGLSVVAEIVKLHGGTISIESTEQVGSTFTIRLPLYTATAEE